MKPWFRVALLLAVVLPAVGCDQATKGLAREHLAGQPSVEMLGGAVLLTYAENAGAALSMGDNLQEPYRRWLFTFGTGAMLVLVLGFALSRRLTTRSELVACALVLGGGIGNLVDRILNDGRVVDFAVVGIGPLRTGVFNVADMFIMAGVLMMFVLVNRKPVPVTA